MESASNTPETPDARAAGANASDGEPLVAVHGLTKLFPVGGGPFRKPSSFIHAVDDVSFQLGHGESLGLVGESGCGKTTVGKLLVKLLEPTRRRDTLPVHRCPGCLRYRLRLPGMLPPSGDGCCAPSAGACR